MLYGAGAMLGPIVTSLTMSAIGIDGFVWTGIAIHVVIAAFLTYRFFAYRIAFKRRPWSEVSLAARPFIIPVTVVSMGRRLRARPPRPPRDP
jgi:hypothetical protein